MQPANLSLIRRILFFLFFVSGFCSLVYQVVWTRLAFASFGIITPVLSVVLSVFMLGLAIGSWVGGRWILRWVEKTGLSAIAFYAGAELMIGVGASAVPRLFSAGQNLLLAAGETNAAEYLVLSALVLTVALLPWCVCMGATFPLMMAFVREGDEPDAGSFSFLYLANVLGAMSGAFLSALVLVELLGFRDTLRVAAAGNFTVALVSGWLAWHRRGRPLPAPRPQSQPVAIALPAGTGPWLIQWTLFSTGFCALAMEVVWTRAFTPVLKTQVYSFALIVFAYLGATFVGSSWYRRHLRHRSPRPTATLLAVLAAVVFLPVLINDPRFLKMDWHANTDPRSAMLLLASVCPFCVALGYLTPRLIDEYARGHPALAGRAYAINVLGCILGPLFASYVLLPRMSERFALILLGLPFLGLYFSTWKSLSARLRGWSVGLVGAGLAWTLCFSNDFESLVTRFSEPAEVRRDYAASVVATGEGINRCLLVNGIGMTRLTPITKFMAHLPLAFHKDPPQSALIICFGMGTSHRSALSWNVDTTAVELVPGVVKVFGFYHADAAQIVNHPQGRIVIDDGRRFLRRTQETFDVIVIDPSPPVETAGASLLYSAEFYDLAKQRLNPGGILQAWFPGGEWLVAQAILRSLCNSFPHVRCFRSAEGWGVHLLASLDPIEPQSPGQLAARLPVSAREDLLEWVGSGDVSAELDRVLSSEIPVGEMLNPDPGIQITDDDPLNEYFWLRRAGLF